MGRRWLSIGQWADRVPADRMCQTTKKDGKYVSETIDEPFEIDL